MKTLPIRLNPGQDLRVAIPAARLCLAGRKVLNIAWTRSSFAPFIAATAPFSKMLQM
jgi:hypothetical protein